jgi:magnesium transporter
MLQELLTRELEELINHREYDRLHDAILDWEAPEIAELLLSLPEEDQKLFYKLLDHHKAADVFPYFSLDLQKQLLEEIGTDQVRLLLDDLDADDRTRLFEDLPEKVTEHLMELLQPDDLKEAQHLLSYPDESVGRLMTPDFLAVRPEWTVKKALDHIRTHGRDVETVNVVYVVDENHKLIDDLRLRALIFADPELKVKDIANNRFVALSAFDDQEVAARTIQDYDRVALPVIDQEGILLGIVTVDDILDVVVEEGTEDMHKIGAVEVMDTPYLDTPFFTLMKKRAFWLILLFFGEMLTASAMGFFEDAIASAVVLAVFVPLIVSSGGNTGSQAAMLVIRAMAVGELTMNDWWKVIRREVLSGLSLGAILGTFGFLRIAAWEWLFQFYGEYWFLIGLTIGLALVGVVLWGTIAGSMLPFLLRRMGSDPATSSAPFVATLVDVTGIILYFSIAILILKGTLL